MVTRSDHTENIDHFLKNLDRATDCLIAINQKPEATNQELTDIKHLFENINESFEAHSFVFGEKKFESEAMKPTIEKALQAIFQYQRNQSLSPPGRRNVEQAIISLSSSLKETLNTLDKNLRNLRKIRIGKKLEKSDQSKAS